MKSKRQVNKKLLLVLLVIGISLLFLFTLNFNKISLTISETVRRVYLASVDVSNMEISTILIDENNNSVTSYEWTATDYEESKTLKYQINYKKNGTSTSYGAGDLQIEIDNLYYNYVNMAKVYDTYIDRFIVVSADKSDSSTKTHVWSYKYNSDKSKIILTNNNAIPASENFEGSVQITYVLPAPSLLPDIASHLYAKLNNTKTSNEIYFYFNSNKKEIILDYQSAYKPSSYESLPSGDYTWFKYSFSLSYGEGTRVLGSSGFKFNVPDDVLIRSDSSLSNHNGYLSASVFCSVLLPQVDSLSGSIAPILCFSSVYIGVPNTYDDDFTFSVTVGGIYNYAGYDHNSYDYEDAFTFEKTVKLSDYEIDGTISVNASLYDNSKHITYNHNIMNTENDLNALDAEFFVTNNKYRTIDVKVGYDFPILQKEDSTYRKLNDDEYNYELISFPGNYSGSRYLSGVFYNGAKKSIPDGSYDVDLYVRYQNETDYVLYDSFKNTGKLYKNFPKRVVGYYFIIHNFDKSMNYLNAPSSFKLYGDNINVGDQVHFYPHITAYENGEFASEYRSSFYKISSSEHSYLTEYEEQYGEIGYWMRESADITDVKQDYRPSIYTQIFENISNGLYRNSVEMNFGIQLVSDYDPGFVGYVLLSEGSYIESLDDLEFRTELPTINDPTGRNKPKIQVVKTQSGRFFKNTEEFSQYVQDHYTVEIINNFKNTNKQAIKFTFDFSDDPFDYTLNYKYDNGLIYFSPYWINYYFDFPVYTSYDAISEYGKDVTVDVITSNSANDIYDSNYWSLMVDEDDYDDDGITNEYLKIDSVSKTAAIATESYQDLKTTVKTNKDNYCENANVSKNTQYTYKLRARNANNKITNLVIYDSIEKYIKRNGNFELAAGENGYFQGTFVDVDTSYAESQGYKVKVYYSQKEQPGDLTSSDWSVYSSSVDKANVKSLAFEYLDSSNNKAILPPDTLTYVEVVMKSNSYSSTEKMHTYNGSWAEWNALDSSNNVIPDVVGINSNVASVASPCRVTVWHNFPISSMSYDEVFDDLIYGSEFTVSPKTDLPPNIVYDKPLFDEPETFVVTEDSKRIYLGYNYVTPNINTNNSMSGTTTIRDSSDQVTYILTQNYSVSDYIGQINQKMTLTLNYNIDVSKSNLNGGVYDASTNTITWDDYIPATSMDEVTGIRTHQATIVYTDLPTSGNFFATGQFRIFLDYVASTSQDLRLTTSYEPKYKITVKHINYYNDTEVFKEEVFYKYKNETYETSPTTSIPDNFKLKANPTNATGTVGTHDININYYYDHKEYTYNHEATITGTSVIYDRSEAVTYNIVFHGDVTDYIGDLNIEIPITLPYKIDLTKSDLNGFTYDEANNKLILTDVIHVTSMEKHSYNYDRTIVLYYLNIPSTDKSIFVRKISRITYYQETGVTKDTNVTTNISKKSKLIVKHVDYDTGELLLPIDETIYPSGSYYSVSVSTSVPQNYDYVSSGEAKTGYIYDEDIEVVLKYKKRTVNTKLYINQFTGPSRTDKRNNVLDYHLEAYSKIENYLGDYSNTATITLKYKIDPSRSDLDGGTYNASNKTITWVHNYSSDDTTEQRKDISHDISLAFIDIPWDAFDIIVSPKLLLTYGEKTSNYNGSSVQTVIDETYPIYIKYVDYQTNEEIAPSETIYAKYYETYTAHESSQIPDKYELKSQPYNYTGRMLNNPTNVIYFYQKKKANLETSIENTTTESITSREDAVDIGIIYHFKTSDYIGSATITIVDQLPYEIDVDSSELDGGTYDPILKTITWIINLDIDSIDEYSEDINKNITVVFKDIDITNDITNIVKGIIQLEDDDDQKETVAVTNINIDGKIVIRYVDENNNEIHEPTIIVKPVNEIYEPEPIVIDGYDLVVLPVKILVTEEEQEIHYSYKKIVEEVKGEEEIENPKTGLANYLLLIIPSVILVFGYKFIGKYKLFKKM